METAIQLVESGPSSPIVIVTWLIEEDFPLQHFLRFHHMIIDAKPALVHFIFHELAVLLQTQTTLAQFQFIARLITAEKPLGNRFLHPF